MSEHNLIEKAIVSLAVKAESLEDAVEQLRLLVPHSHKTIELDFDESLAEEEI